LEHLHGLRAKIGGDLAVGIGAGLAGEIDDAVRTGHLDDMAVAGRVRHAGRVHERRLDGGVCACASLTTPVTAPVRAPVPAAIVTAAATKSRREAVPSDRAGDAGLYCVVMVDSSP